MSVSIRWRENYSVDFNQTCSKHINYANKDAREGFLKNLRINPVFGQKKLQNKLS